MKLERAVLYARVSGDETRTQASSLTSQLNMCREYASRKGYTVLHELAEDDRGASGAEINLPQLNRVRELARTKVIKVVVVRELDRLSRSLAKQLLIEEELRHSGVRVEYVLADYDDTPEGEFQKHIRATVAEYERQKITERLHRGRRERVQRGNVITGARPPYGYREVHREDVTVLEIVPEQAEVVQSIFLDFVVYGKSAYYIRARLTEALIPTWGDLNPTMTRKKLPFGHWSASSVLQILRNETYAGVWQYGNPPITVQVPAIIDPETYRIAQDKLATNKQRSLGNTRHKALLARRMTCGICGYRVHLQRLYYQCPATYIPTYQRECNLPSFQVKRTDAAVWAWVEQLLYKPEFLEDVIAVYRTQQSPLLEQREVLNRLLDRNHTEFAHLLAAIKITSGRAREALAADLAHIESTMLKLEAERDALNRELDSFQVSSEQQKAVRDCLDELAADLKVVDFATKRNVIDILDLEATLTVRDNQKVIDLATVVGRGCRTLPNPTYRLSQELNQIQFQLRVRGTTYYAGTDNLSGLPEGDGGY